ncbi:TBC1 domain family member 2A isoform X2 [Brachyistius frenatus]|uniref:TBC1 domain family member 2A isoform X2 n=1 Tax=Brachyistius frenatus TaxID=100188 RepID=UPI0037E895C6
METGNPSATLSHLLPVPSAEGTLHPDWTSGMEEDRESISLSLKHQSPTEGPQGPDLTNHPDPPTEKQNLEDSKDELSPDPPEPDPLCMDQKPGEPLGPKQGQEPGLSQDLQNQKNLCCTDHRTEEAPPLPHLNPQQTPPPPHLNPQQTPPSPHLNTQQTPPPPHLNTHQTSLPPHLNTQQTSPSPHLNTHQTPPPPHLITQQTPPPPHLNPQQTPHLNTQQTPPSPHLNTQQTPPSPHLNTHQTPLPPHLNPQQTPPSPHLNTHQTPPPPHLNTHQTPLPPHLNTQQTPPSPHLNTQQTPPPSHLNPQQTPHLNTKQTPPSPHLNTQQTPPPPHLNTHHTPLPPHLNTQQTPSPPHLNTYQTPPSPHLNTQQTPHLNTQQTHPFIQLNTQQTPPFIQLNIQQTPPPPTGSTLAPPLTIEAFCDEVRPHPEVSSSGEPKLCGYLQKQGGPLKAWKQRWFTYEEKKNQLFYYRTPQDVLPLGRVELNGATFTYPLTAENGSFHIKTAERTFILKAVTQDLMLYWLQQLQVKRWQHRQTFTCSEPTNNNNNNNPADDFLPVLKSPLGLVGEEAANVPTQRTPLGNMSIKHPLIEIQNSVHSLRKRSSQDWTQSVFHVDAPTWTPPPAADITNSTPSAFRTPAEPPTPPTPLPLADAAGQVSPAEGRESPSLFGGRSRKSKMRSTSIAPVLRRDTVTASSDRMLRLQQEKQMLMEEVKAQKELVWILHKALEASQLEKRTCAEFLAEEGEQERLELLRHRERQAANLRGQLEEAELEAESTRRSLAQRDLQLVELQENIRILTEKNNAKEEVRRNRRTFLTAGAARTHCTFVSCQVIIKLSDQVTTCLSDLRRSGSFSGSPSGSAPSSQTFRRLQQETENLKDDIEAYKIQNKFLNSEIYQLTKLWRNSSEQEKSLMVKCAYLEATNCQTESRYLGVLRKLQETKSLDPAQREAVQKMIEIALKGEQKSVVKVNTDRDHDEYGFKIIPEYEVEDMKLLAKIQALEIRSHNLLHQEGMERPLLSRWAQYLAGRSDQDLGPSLDLKVLLRGGVPQEYRSRVWRWLVRARTSTIRDRHPLRYQQLCEKSRTSPHPASRQIQLDLHRTLTTNQHFSSPSSPALQQLRRILLAFSWQNPTVGYCQGLNRLAAIALLVLRSEEDAFWCLVSVVDTIMPQDYYTHNLVASQADQRVLKDFMSEKLPRLAAHFEDHGVDVSLITFNWFLVVFVESLPSDILLPLWDAFLYEGTKVIFRYTLALFKYKEDDILKIQDSVEIYRYLRFFTKTISDSRKLSSIAFNDMNPFPRRLLRNRRALHLERLQGELQELEEQQREFVTESAERKDKELDAMMSEDDDDL